MSIHALRHTFSTICFLNEVPAEQVQTALEHSSIRTTKDMYANYIPQLATKAISALSEVLDPDTDQRHLEVVKLAGVQRTTVTGWRNKNITFIAEWNRRRKQRLAAAGERLHEVTVAALDAVSESIKGGDTTAALALIRMVGVEHLLSAAQPGPTTPMGVHQDLAADLKSDLMGEMFVTEEISWMVERDSDASAG